MGLLRSVFCIRLHKGAFNLFHLFTYVSCFYKPYLSKAHKNILKEHFIVFLGTLICYLI